MKTANSKNNALIKMENNTGKKNGTMKMDNFRHNALI